MSQEDGKLVGVRGLERERENVETSSTGPRLVLCGLGLGELRRFFKLVFTLLVVMLGATATRSTTLCHTMVCISTTRSGVVMQQGNVCQNLVLTPSMQRDEKSMQMLGKAKQTLCLSLPLDPQVQVHLNGVAYSGQ